MLRDDAIQDIKKLKNNGEYSSALDSLQKLEKKYGTDDPSLIKILSLKADILFVQGETEDALKVGNMALKIIAKRNPLGVKKEEAQLYSLLGHIIGNRGKKSLAYILKSAEIHTEIGDEEGIAYSMNDIANYYYSKMMLDKALEYYTKFKQINERLGNRLNVVVSLVNLGSTYIAKGELNTAIIYLDKCLGHKEEFGNLYYFAAALSDKIRVYMIKNEREKVPVLLDELEQIAISSDIPYSRQCYEVSKAIYLKSSKRSRDKAKAEEIFLKIINEPIIYLETTVQSIKHMIELLLFEYKTYEEEDVLIEIKDLIDRMYGLANERQEFKTLIESLILQSRLKQFENEFEDAENILDRAISMAQEIDSPVMLDTVNSEKESLSQNFNKLQKIMRKNLTLAEKFETSNIMEYLRKAQGMIDKKEQIE